MAKGRNLLWQQAMSYLALALLCISSFLSCGKKPKDSTKAEEPNFAAKSFNSKMAFRVFVQETSWSEPKLIGSTPSDTPLEIPSCWIWEVELSGPVKDWDLIVREIKQNKIPGLHLSSFVTDSDLKNLVGLTGLRALWLNNTKITDVGLKYLKDLVELKLLDLGGTQITDVGLEYIVGLTGLQKLDLSGTEITDAG